MRKKRSAVSVLSLILLASFLLCAPSLALRRRGKSGGRPHRLQPRETDCLAWGDHHHSSFRSSAQRDSADSVTAIHLESDRWSGGG